MTSVFSTWNQKIPFELRGCDFHPRVSIATLFPVLSALVGGKTAFFALRFEMYYNFHLCNNNKVLIAAEQIDSSLTGLTSTIFKTKLHINYTDCYEVSRTCKLNVKNLFFVFTIAYGNCLETPEEAISNAEER